MNTHLERTGLTKERIEQSRANIKLSIALCYALLFVFWTLLFIDMYYHTSFYQKYPLFVIIGVTITSTILYMASDKLRRLLLKYNWVSEEQMLTMYHESSFFPYVHINFLETVCERPFLTIFEYDILTQRIDDEIMEKAKNKDQSEKLQWMDLREQLCIKDQNNHG